jgi:glycosyltransferase involved in cell wall biosynthesis
MKSISVIIITLNESLKIEACLDSVKWTDEIIVIDSGSTDNTVEICKKYTDKVYETDWPGFGPQKNRALSYASCDWVLSIDADEVVTPELKEEIQSALLNETFEIYDIPRLSSFCGRDLHYGGWRPDYVTRLFKNGSASFSNDLVHERLVFETKKGKLKESLTHASIDDLDSMLSKINAYSTAGTQRIVDKGKQVGLFSALSHGFWIFIRTYFLRLGFLDGKEGFIMAVSAGENTYYRYLKAYYLQKSKP